MKNSFKKEFLRFSRLANQLAPWAKDDKLKDHEPKWHQFGIKRHTLEVLKVADYLYKKTKIDVRRAAIWHDIGKYVVRKKKDGQYSFKGHEKASVEILKKYQIPLTEEEFFIIEHHGDIIKKSISRIKKICKDKNLLAKLVILAVADKIGKGETPLQNYQRKLLMGKYVKLAELAGLDPKLIENLFKNNLKFLEKRRKNG